MTLAKIVKSALNRRGAYSATNMARYTTIAAEYYSEQINMFITDNVEVAYMNFNGTRIKKLPEDYIDYTKVGININGEVWTLGLNKHLVKPRKEDCGDRVDNLGVTAHHPGFTYAFHDHYRDGVFVSGLQTVGGGWNTGYFNVDKDERLLIIDGHIPKGEVILEYISTGIKKDGLTYIPYHAVNAVRMYVLWQMDEYDRNVPMSTKKDRERQFLEAEEQAKWFEEAPTLSEILDIFNESYTPGAKR